MGRITTRWCAVLMLCGANAAAESEKRLNGWFEDWQAWAFVDGAGNEVAWHALNVDSGGGTTLVFSCRLPIMESVVAMWTGLPEDRVDGRDLDLAGLIVGNLYRREGFLEMLVPVLPDAGERQLTIDYRVDGKPWMMANGVPVSSTKLSLHFHERELEFASRLSIGVREISSSTAAVNIVHHIGRGLDEAIDWVNNRCNHAPEIRRLRREWTYPSVTRRLAR